MKEGIIRVLEVAVKCPECGSLVNSPAHGLASWSELDLWLAAQIENWVEGPMCHVCGCFVTVKVPDLPWLEQEKPVDESLDSL